MDFDAIGALETLYRTDLPGPAWLLAVMEAARPLIDPERRGVHGALYRCSDPLSFTLEGTPSLFEYDERLRDVLHEGLQGMTEDFVSGMFLCHGVVRGATVQGWNDISTLRSGAFRARGLSDALNVVAIEPDGTGCCFASFHGQAAVLPKFEGHLLRGIARHFSAAHRMQRRLKGAPPLPDRADAILDSNGRVHHAQGLAATDPSFRQRLQASVRRSEGARARRRRRDPHEALSAWESLVVGRWTLVDYFDHDGRRYLLALENAPRAAGIDLLSPRERAVVEQALRGLDNKVIAYDLGIAHSTVKVLISRAACKLGVRTRRELLRRLGHPVANLSSLPGRRGR